MPLMTLMSPSATARGFGLSLVAPMGPMVHEKSKPYRLLILRHAWLNL